MNKIASREENLVLEPHGRLAMREEDKEATNIRCSILEETLCYNSTYVLDLLKWLHVASEFSGVTNYKYSKVPVSL